MGQHPAGPPPTLSVIIPTLAEALTWPDVVGGCFSIRFDGPRRAARLLTCVYPRLSWLGLCYVDSAFFVARQSYERVGGFRPFPLFEDLDLQKRLPRFGLLV